MNLPSIWGHWSIDLGLQVQHLFGLQQVGKHRITISLANYYWNSKGEILLCKGHKGYFELVFLKDLGEFSIFEGAIKFHGLMVHSGKKIVKVASVKKNQT